MCLVLIGAALSLPWVLRNLQDDPDSVNLTEHGDIDDIDDYTHAYEYMPSGDYVPECDNPSDNNDEHPNGIPKISSDFDIEIPFISPGEVFLVGILDFEEDTIYHLSLYAAQGRGAFVGVTNSPDITSASNSHAWRPMLSGSDVQTTITHHEQGYVYLYVGSTADVSSTVPGADLYDVAVSLRVQR